MKSDNIGFFLLTALLSLSLVSPGEAADLSKQPFQAEYELSSARGKSIHKLSCDGKGHGRSEMISEKRHSVSIMDYDKHQVFILVPETKTVMTMALTDNDINNIGSFGQKVRSSAKPLGLKLMDGHMCTGTHYELEGGSVEEIWTGNDIGGTRVYSKVTMPQFGVSEAHLKSYVPVSPAPDAFVIPADYQKK